MHLSSSAITYAYSAYSSHSALAGTKPHSCVTVTQFFKWAISSCKQSVGSFTSRSYTGTNSDNSKRTSLTTQDVILSVHIDSSFRAETSFPGALAQSIPRTGGNTPSCTFVRPCLEGPGDSTALQQQYHGVLPEKGNRHEVLGVLAVQVFNILD